MERKILIAHLFLFIVALIYGANYTIAKVVLDDGYIGPKGFILIRAVSGFILFFLFHKFFVKEKIQKKDFGLLALCGLFGVAINQMFFFIGLKLTSPINASLIMLTTPMLVLMISAIMIKEKITPIKVIGLTLGAVGATLLITGNKSGNGGEGNIIGDLMILVNATSYGIYLVLVKKLMQKYNPITIVKWVFFFGMLYVTPFGLGEFMEIDTQSFIPKVWYAIIFVILGTTFMTYLLNAKALKIVNPSVVSAYIYLQPLIASLIAIIFSSYSLNLRTILSAMIIGFGLYLSAFFNKAKSTKQ